MCLTHVIKSVFWKPSQEIQLLWTSIVDGEGRGRSVRRGQTKKKIEGERHGVAGYRFPGSAVRAGNPVAGPALHRIA